MVADDDGVVVVRKEEAAKVLADSKAREEKEAGELSLDIFGFRNGLVERGLKYIGRDPEA